MAWRKMRGVLVMLFLCWTFPCLAEFIPMDREMLIQHSEAIILGTVVDKKSFWNAQKSLILTRVIFEVEETLWGGPPPTLILRFAGGTIGKEKHTVSDVPEFEIGERVLLMVASMTQNLMTPLVGGLQGVFVEEDSIDFAAVVQDIRTLIPVAKAKTLGPVFSPELPAPSKTFFDVPVNTSTVFIPRPPSDPLNTENKSVSEEPLQIDTEINASRELEECEQPFAKPYIIFTPWNIPEISKPDQESMGYWNQLHDIFRLWSPLLPKKWRNGCSDIFGVLTLEQLKAAFGNEAEWGMGQQSAIFSATHPKSLKEVDIVLNRAVQWTTDRREAYFSPNVYSYHDIFLRTLGFALGLGMSGEISITNPTAPKPVRAYARIYTNDANQAKNLHPQISPSVVQDAGISLHAGLYFDLSHLLPKIIYHLDTLTIKFLLENVNATDMKPVFIEWFFAERALAQAPGFSLGLRLFKLPPVGQSTLQTVTLTIPEWQNMFGNYYLHGRIIEFGQGGGKDVIWQNNRYWSTRPIEVKLKSKE